VTEMNWGFVMSYPNLASLANNITTTYKNFLCYKIKAVAVYNCSR